jgi:hypothetical protein
MMMEIGIKKCLYLCLVELYRWLYHNAMHPCIYIYIYIYIYVYRTKVNEV